MKRVLLGLILSLTVALTGVANTQEWQKDKKPPERPVEKPKDDKRNDPPKNDRGGDKKKPDSF